MDWHRLSDRRIAAVDPQGAEALALPQQAAQEVRTLYPALHDPARPAPLPVNAPPPLRAAYLQTWQEAEPLGVAAQRPLDRYGTELRQDPGRPRTAWWRVQAAQRPHADMQRPRRLISDCVGSTQQETR